MKLIQEMMRGSRVIVRNLQRKRKLSTNKRKPNKLYCMGEGWTGALGTNSFQSIQSSNIIPNSSEDLDIDSNLMEESFIPDAHYDMSNGLIELPLEQNSTIDNVSCGWGHTLLTFNDQSMTTYMTGRPFDFRSLLRLRRLPILLRDLITCYVTPQLQSSEQPDVFAGFKELNFSMEHVTKHQASAGTTMILTKDNKVYSFGRNEYGQCGQGRESIQITWPPHDASSSSKTPISFEIKTDLTTKNIRIEEFQDISLGLQHGCLLSLQNQVFTFGKSNRGQCGNVDFQLEHSDRPSKNKVEYYRVTPTLVPNLPTINAIKSGFHHSVAFSQNENLLFTWGRNIKLNHKDKVTDVNLPIAINNLPPLKIVDFACTSHSTLILLEDGSIWGIGATVASASSSNLNHTIIPPDEPMELLPADSVIFPIRQFTASFDRGYVIGDDGKQLIEFQLGYDNNYGIPLWFFDLRERKEVVKLVSRGWLHSFIVTEVE